MPSNDAVDTTDIDYQPPKPPHWYTFLKRACIPTVSPNDSIQRIDVVAPELIAMGGGIQPRRILDLGAGHCLYLVRLLERHDREGHIVHGGLPIHYNAVEQYLPPIWRSLTSRATTCPQCFAAPKSYPVDLTREDLLAVPLGQGPFDLILATFLLHELDPEALIDLLLALRPVLADEGHLCIVDPDACWPLSDEAWTADWISKSEWEVNGLWHPANSFESVLEALKFKATVRALVPQRDRMALWIADARRVLGEPDRTEAIERLRECHRLQARADLERYSTVREKVLTHLRGEFHNCDQRELKTKAVQLGAISATYCRRMEFVTATEKA